MGAPAFPTGSLAGGFPTFPVNYASLPDVVALPGWVASEIAYYTDVLDAPYSNPPQLATWSIPYPNIVALPQFFYRIAVWLIGLFGAVFEWLFQEAEYLGVTYLGDLANTANGIIVEATNYVQGLAAATGIFAPVVEAVFFAGFLIFAVIAGFAVKDLIVAVA